MFFYVSDIVLQRKEQNAQDVKEEVRGRLIKCYFGRYVC